MTTWERTSRPGRSPFSATPLTAQARGARRDGARIDVTASLIPDAGPTASAVAPATVSTALVPADPLRARTVVPGRMAPRPANLRLLPLGAFTWGGPGSRPLPRTRSDHVLIWVCEGSARLDLPRHEEILGADRLLFVPAGTAFALAPHAPVQGQVLMIAPSLAQGIDPPLPDRMLAGCAGRKAAMLGAALAELGSEAGRGADRRTLHCYLGVVSLHLERLSAAQPGACGIGAAPRPAVAPVADPFPAPDRRLVEAFLTLAATQLGTCLTLSDLAQEMGTTQAALDRACLSARGRPALDLLHALRVEEAARLLRETDLSATHIAQETGFAGHAHMTRTFADRMGRTPEAYRYQMRHPG